MNNNTRIAYSVLINIFIICGLLLILAMSGQSYDGATLLIIILLTLFSIINYTINCLSDKKFKGQYIRCSYLFALGYVIVFFQKNIDLLCGYITSNNAVFYNSTIINSCASISGIGFCCFSIGNILAQNVVKKPQSSSLYRPLRRSFMLFQKVMLAICTIYYTFSVFKTVVSGNYAYNEETMAQNAGSLLNYSFVLVLVFTFTFLVSTIFICRKDNKTYTLKQYILSNGWLFNGSLVIFLSLQFMIGDRGPLINICLAYFISYIIISHKKIKPVPIIIAVISVGIILSAISQVRKQAHIVTMSDIMNKATESNNGSILPATQELAGSYKTFTYSVANIPQHRDFFYGTNQLRELAFSIPMFHRLVPFIFSDKEYENGSTSYCTYLIQGLNRTYGNGSSLLADIYLDFGLIGIILILPILGALIYKFDLALYFGNNLYWMLAALVFFSFSVYISRATLSTPLYYMLPGFLIIYMHRYFRK